MIILDTNVISEAMKPSANPTVLSWLNAQAAETLYLTSISLAELLFGINSLPDGKRKNTLSAALDGLLALFGDRILSFDNSAARSYAQIATHARTTGKGLPLPDGFIAAIAEAKGFMVATRDTAPFEAANLRVINPWDTHP
jgi:toxin FitB